MRVVRFAFYFLQDRRPIFGMITFKLLIKKAAIWIFTEKYSFWTAFVFFFKYLVKM